MLKGVIFLLKFAWKNKKSYIIDSIVLQFISALIPLVSIVLPKFIIDELTMQRRWEYLVLYIGLLVVVNFVGSSLCAWLQSYCFVAKGQFFVDFQAMLTEKLSSCDYEQLENPHFLDTREKARKFLYANGHGFGVVMDNAFAILGKLFVFAGIVIVVLRLNIWIVLLFAGLVLINTLFESRLREKYVKWDMEKAPIERRTNYLISVIEDFNYGKEIRTYGIKNWLIQKVRTHLSASQQFYKKQTKETTKANYLACFTGFLREAVTYSYLAYRVIMRTITIGDFTMYVSAVANFSSAMNDVMDSILEIKEFGGYYDALNEYMNVPAKMAKSGSINIAQKQSHVIEFCNVSFRYPGQNAWALHDINIRIEAGEKLSIVGENGAGKTTFIKLLNRLYDPTEGIIYLDGIDIREINYENYLSLISTVYQDYRLFSFTVKENIVFDREVPNAQVTNILSQSGFDNINEKLKHGINTYVHKNFEPEGFEPSGGEGQKIALARALYKNAPIIILDEPAASLDPRAEYDLYSKFNTLTDHKTAIFISHRMSSSKFCDKIALFTNGEITEYGTHNELMSCDTKYRELFSMQAQYYN